MQELSVQEIDEVNGGIVFVILAILNAASHGGIMGTSTGSSALDAVVGGNLGA